MATERMDTLPLMHAVDQSNQPASREELPRRWASLLRQLLACAAPLRRRLREAGSDLAENQLLLLLTVEQADGGPLDQRQLSAALGLSPGQVSSLVETLRQGEWVCGQRDPSDRRRQCWRLTDLGRQRLSAGLQAASQAWQPFERRVSPALERQLADLLSHLEQTLAASPAAVAASEPTPVSMPCATDIARREAG